MVLNILHHQAFAVVVAVLAVLRDAQGEGSGVCSSDLNGGNEYMCVDWSVGSATMKAAQDKYYKATGESVIFGLGSYGSEENGKLGKCYRFQIDTGADDIIAQVTNFGADVENHQFDMQMGGGGFGVWNACADAAYHVVSTAAYTGNKDWPCTQSATEAVAVPPLYSYGTKYWGARCGGQQYVEDCSYLPEYPTALKDVPDGEPTLIELCETSFDWKVRQPDHSTMITEGHQVPCPDALVDVTNFKRDDDDSEETMGTPGLLTSTMDCCAPAGSYSYHTLRNGALSDHLRLVPCTQDGYTRSTL